jgi:hypothetical protein
MKKVIFLLLGLPCMATAQTNNVFSIDRVFPKVGQTQQFEKALVAHEQKYHKGDWTWQVYTVETGPDQGAYRTVEGPLSWDKFDHRGNLGEAHQTDYAKTVAPYLTERSTTSFTTFREDLSTAKMTDKADKVAMNHIYPKPGYGEEVEEILKKLKKVWEASGQSVGVYEASSSGAPQFVVMILYKQGLKEREMGFRKPMKERYAAANGDGSWAAYMQSIREAVDHTWSEMLYYHPELSSK